MRCGRLGEASCAVPVASHTALLARLTPTGRPARPLTHPQAVSQFLANKTVAATRLYWSRHRERLGLDGIMAERAAAGLGPEDHAPGAAAAVPVGPAAAAAAGLPDLQQAWAPLLDHLQRQATAGEGSADLGAAPAPAGDAAAAAGPESAAAAPQAAAAAATEPGAEPAAMQVDAPAETAAIKPEPEPAAGAAAQPLGAAAAAGGEQPPAAEAAAAQSGAPPPAGEQAAVPGGEGAAAAPLATAAEAASLLPREELAKLQTLLEPGVCMCVRALRPALVASGRALHSLLLFLPLLPPLSLLVAKYRGLLGATIAGTNTLLPPAVFPLH